MRSPETLTIQPPDLDIEAIVGNMIAPHTDVQEARDVYSDFIDKLELPRIDRFKYVLPSVKKDRDALLPLVKDPYDSVVTEMTSLRDVSAGRTVHGRRGTQTFDLFVTRNTSQTDVDARYRLVTSETKKPLMTIETHLQSQLDEPCVFQVANGALKVLERRWQRGGWQYHEHNVHENSTGEKLLLGFVSSTLYAGHVALYRTNAERQSADKHARQLAFNAL